MMEGSLVDMGNHSPPSTVKGGGLGHPLQAPSDLLQTLSPYIGEHKHPWLSEARRMMGAGGGHQLLFRHSLLSFQP